MSDPFAAMHQALQASSLFVDARLRGQAIRVFVDRSVEMLGEYGQVVGQAVMVDIPTAAAPVADDYLTLPATGEQFVLDRVISNDGYSARWVLRSE